MLCICTYTIVRTGYELTWLMLRTFNRVLKPPVWCGALNACGVSSAGFVMYGVSQTSWRGFRLCTMLLSVNMIKNNHGTKYWSWITLSSLSCLVSVHRKKAWPKVRRWRLEVIWVLFCKTGGFNIQLIVSYISLVVPCSYWSKHETLSTSWLID